MKRIHFLLALTILAFSSCSIYKNSQTPDDVYYSPGVQKDGYVAATNNNNDQGEYYSTPNDRYVRMRVQDPARWSYFDDYGYDSYNSFGYSPYSSFGYSPYGYSSFSYGLGFGSPWIGGFGYYSPLSYYNSYYAWNSYYNPYYSGIVVINSKVPASSVYTPLRPFNAGSYSNTNYNRNNNNRGNSFLPYSQPIRNNANTGLGNTLRRAFNGSGNNSSGYQPTRTYTPSSSGSSPSSGGSRGGGGGGSVSRPGRG